MLGLSIVITRPDATLGLSIVITHLGHHKAYVRHCCIELTAFYLVTRKPPEMRDAGHPCCSAMSRHDKYM